MIKNLLSRYSFHYPRALVYMLQSSEYNLRNYLNWYRRTNNFARVERRKSLIKTPKSLLMLTIAWVMLFTLYAGAFTILFSVGKPLNYLIFLLTLLLIPFVLGYIIIVPLIFIKLFIQTPVEFFIIETAKKKLQTHKGVRIAIAGSFGKTTMREILKTVLAEGKKVAAPPHSHNTALSISRFIRNLKGDEDILIFELGEYYPGDVRQLCQLVQPQIGIITGVNEAHLAKFKSLKQTTGTIFELADWLGEKPLYINGESQLARGRALASHILYSRNGVGEWQVKNAHTDLNGLSFVLSKNGLTVSCRSKLIGLHQIGPLATAIDIANRLGISLGKIQQGAAKTKAFEHRLEPTETDDIVTIDDSYNGNPDGARAAIEFLGSLKNRRRFYATPGLVEMGSRTETAHQEIGKSLARAEIENVVLIKNSVTVFIEQGLKQARYDGKILWFDDAPSAHAALPHLTVKGDVVLLQNDWPDQYE